MNLVTRFRKYREYRRTVHALRNLPRDIALDLDIYPGAAETIARRAVWGDGGK